MGALTYSCPRSSWFPAATTEVRIIVKFLEAINLLRLHDRTITATLQYAFPDVSMQCSQAMIKHRHGLSVTISSPWKAPLNLPPRLHHHLEPARVVNKVDKIVITSIAPGSTA